MPRARRRELTTSELPDPELTLRPPGRSWAATPDPAPGEPAADFMISGPDAHGLPGLVNLFGIESPGLTASLAIADRVAAIVGTSGCGRRGA